MMSKRNIALWIGFMYGAILFHTYQYAGGKALHESQVQLHETVSFKRGAAETYTCADEPAAGGYLWLARGGKPIKEFFENTGWQYEYLENGRQIMLRSPNNTSTTKLFLFCVRNDNDSDVIHSLTIRWDPGNEKYRGFTETTCDIYDNRQPELICQGASEYRIYKCDWYLEGNPDPIASDHEPSLRLGTGAAPLVPGTYRCECEIGHGKHELRTFPVRAVGAGPVKESKFCRQWLVDGDTGADAVMVNDATSQATVNDGRYTKGLSGDDPAESEISQRDAKNSETKHNVSLGVLMTVIFALVLYSVVLTVLYVKGKRKNAEIATSTRNSHNGLIPGGRVGYSRSESATVMDDTGES